MRKPLSKDVEHFLNGMMAINPEHYHAIAEIREIVFNTYPETSEKMMYGGIVFFLKDKMFSGVFSAKNHVTLEFSNGFEMDDTAGHLEGKGKYRRHLKIRKKEDVIGKEVSYFVKQAVS